MNRLVPFKFTFARSTALVKHLLFIPGPSPESSGTGCTDRGAVVHEELRRLFSKGSKAAAKPKARFGLCAPGSRTFSVLRVDLFAGQGVSPFKEGFVLGHRAILFIPLFLFCWEKGKGDCVAILWLAEHL